MLVVGHVGPDQWAIDDGTWRDKPPTYIQLTRLGTQGKRNGPSSGRKPGNTRSLSVGSEGGKLCPVDAVGRWAANVDAGVAESRGVP